MIIAPEIMRHSVPNGAIYCHANHTTKITKKKAALTTPGLNTTIVIIMVLLFTLFFDHLLTH